jgi:ubiquinone/menaquinone biosynthesis C-methylase UbiE
MTLGHETLDGDITLFTAVDRTADPGFFARFLDAGNDLPAIRASKSIMLDQMRLSEGAAVLDAGCGTGADALELARIVGPTGRVVGIDVSETMINGARRRAAGADDSPEFEVGDAQSLRFDDDAFDATRTERMLMHVPDAVTAFAELVRVTRSGGRVVVFDFDWDTAIVDSAHRPTTRRIMRSFADGIRNGWIGRQLPRLFREHGLIDVTVTPHTVLFPYEFAELLWGGHLTRAQEAGTVTPAEVAQWWAGLNRAHEQQCFFAGLTAFIVAGTKT